MLAVEFTFLAGRYHATPWGRHVNEGAVAWPPEPWRILRALVATWHNKVKAAGNHSEATLRGLIESLASELPQYRLPRASHAHVRHYMPQFAPGKTTLVLDAFAAVARDEPLAVIWPTLELRAEQQALLDDLLGVMGYLGRAEAWVEARRVLEVREANCLPGEEGIDAATGEIHGEITTLYAPLAPAAYRERREGFLADKKMAKKLASTLPDDFVDAIAVSTGDLRKHRWSHPPAARGVRYISPIDALKPQRSFKNVSPPGATTARLTLTGKPLPRVEETLRLGELLRLAVMSHAGRQYGEDSIPPVLSGHGMPDGNRHRHAFYLPWDSDGDGRLDRLFIHAPDGLDAKQQGVLAAVARLWSRDGGEWQVTLEGVGGSEVAPELVRPSTVWRSATPYLHPWHRKKAFGVADQLRRECRERGLPEPVGVEQIPRVEIGRGRSRRSVDFQRHRRGRGTTQPDRLGGFWRLTFAEPLCGPLALGVSCHLGLGLFVPDS